MKQLLIHDDAEAELEGAVDFYESQYAGLGIDFIHEVRHGLGLVMESPLSWSPYIANTHRYVLRQFPFSIVYLDLPDAIWVVAFPHHKRSPFYWQSRLSS